MHAYTKRKKGGGEGRNEHVYMANRIVAKGRARKLKGNSVKRIPEESRFLPSLEDRGRDRISLDQKGSPISP